MLTKTTEIDQITADKFSNIMWREVTTVFEDGVQISQKYHRSSSSGENKASPGAALASMPAEVQVFARAAWTPENIAPVTDAVVLALQDAAKKRAELQDAITASADAEAEMEQRKKFAEAAKTAAEQAEAASKAAADAAQAEADRLTAALAAQVAAEKALADKAAFDKAVADAVAAQLAPVEAVV